MTTKNHGSDRRRVADFIKVLSQSGEAMTLRQMEEECLMSYVSIRRWVNELTAIGAVHVVRWTYTPGQAEPIGSYKWGPGHDAVKPEYPTSRWRR